jgi:hypothetical protein
MILIWRLFLNRLPTKENLRKRGINLNSSALCVGGCGSVETENHLFFCCPIPSLAWNEVGRWLGISIVLGERRPEHLILFKNSVTGGKES